MGEGNLSDCLIEFRILGSGFSIRVLLLHHTSSPVPSFQKQTTIEVALCRAIPFFARKLFQFLLAYNDFPHLGFAFFFHAH